MTDLESIRPPGERWNPILVKEVRQALRGRVFRITFVLTLAAATIAAFSNIVDPSETVMGTGTRGARVYFHSLYICLSIALLVVVPFTAFQAVGNEWEENTFDLLSLSRLRPRRIVLGKFWSAGVQALLFAAVFVPFLTVGYLLPGTDLRAATLSLLVLAAAAAMVTLTALALSTVTRQRFVRVLLLLALAALALPTFFTVNQICDAALRDPSFLWNRQALPFLGLWCASVLLVAAYLFALACNMLAHAEENRSSNVRLITTVGLVTLLGVATWAAPLLGGVESLSALATAGLAVVSFVGLFLATERRELGRRVTHLVPRSPVLALVCAPWFPGGGRGALLHLLHVGLVALWTLVAAARLHGPGAPPLDDGVGATLLACAFSLVYVLLVPVLGARFAQQPGTRVALRIAVPVLVLLSVLLPSVVGAVIGDPRLQRFENPWNPFWLVDRAWRPSGLAPRYYAVAAGLAGFVLLLNAPRIVGGLAEMAAAASAKVRARAGVGADPSRREEAGDAGSLG